MIESTPAVGRGRDGSKTRRGCVGCNGGKHCGATRGSWQSHTGTGTSAWAHFCRRAHRGRVVNDRVPHDDLVEHVGVRLVLGGDVDEELLHVPVEDGAEVGVDAEREDRLVVRCEV